MVDPVDFSIGAPDFPAPGVIKEAAIEAIRQDKNGYTMTTGYEPLRQKVGQKVGLQFGWSNPQVIVTCGVSGGLNLVLPAVVNPGDEVLIPDPSFAMYRHLINMLGGKCVWVDTYPDFQLSAEKLARKITPKSKVLIINSPSNPTGTVYSSEQLKQVAEVAKRHNLLVISDDIYQEFSYDGPAAGIARYYENTVVLGGFSKSHGVPGWRLGYLAVAAHMKELFESMATLQQYTFVCAPHPLQIAVCNAFDCGITEEVAAYRRRRDMVYDGLKDHFDLIKPAGAFYAFVGVRGGKAGEFVTSAIKNNVLVIPGAVFSQRDSHFRLSYATSEKQIARGIEKLCDLAKKS